jgi:ABC-type glycerol-3-phosphate transport system permease component
MTEHKTQRRRFAWDRFKNLFGGASKHAFLIAVVIFSLAPIFWLVTIAFRPVEETYVTPMKLLPSTLTLENTTLVIEKLPKLILLYRNSIIITGTTVFLVVICTSLAGFAFARLKFPGRDILFWLVVAAMFMPKSMMIPGLYEVLRKLDLIDTLGGLIMPYTGWFLSLNLFIMRSAFQSIPRDLEDAAIVDGASTFRLFSQLMMPLVSTSLVTVAILTFVPVWGEYLFAFTFTTSMSAMPMSVGIKFLQAGPAQGEWTFPVASMAVIVSFIPPLIIYLGLQRWFSKGLLEGALKF